MAVFLFDKFLGCIGNKEIDTYRFPAVKNYSSRCWPTGHEFAEKFEVRAQISILFPVGGIDQKNCLNNTCTADKPDNCPCGQAEEQYINDK